MATSLTTDGAAQFKQLASYDNPCSCATNWRCFLGQGAPLKYNFVLCFPCNQLQLHYNLTWLPLQAAQLRCKLGGFPTKTFCSCVNNLAWFPTTSTATQVRTARVSYEISCSLATSRPCFLRQAAQLRCRLLMLPTKAVAASLLTGLVSYKQCSLSAGCLGFLKNSCSFATEWVCFLRQAAQLWCRLLLFHSLVPAQAAQFRCKLLVFPTRTVAA